MKNSFVMYTDYMEHIALLDRGQRGDLLTAMIAYAGTGDIPDMDAVTEMAFSFIRAQMDRDSQKYQEIVGKRRDAGKQGGRPKANGFPEQAKKANGFSEKQMKAKKPDTDTDTDTDTVNDNTKKKDAKASKENTTGFVEPTVENVIGYCRGMGYTDVDAERFVDFYASKGWYVGKNKMRDWKAAVRNWARQGREGMCAGAQKSGNPPNKNQFQQFPQRDIDYDAIVIQQIVDTGGPP